MGEFERCRAALVAAVVLMVSCVLHCPFPFGVSVAGWNEQAVFDGSVPHEKLIVPLKKLLGVMVRL
jgi:hypothetical protein